MLFSVWKRVWIFIKRRDAFISNIFCILPLHQRTGSSTIKLTYSIYFQLFVSSMTEKVFSIPNDIFHYWKHHDRNTSMFLYWKLSPMVCDVQTSPRMEQIICNNEVRCTCLQLKKLHPPRCLINNIYIGISDCKHRSSNFYWKLLNQNCLDIRECTSLYFLALSYWKKEWITTLETLLRDIYKDSSFYNVISEIAWVHQTHFKIRFQIRKNSNGEGEHLSIFGCLYIGALFCVVVNLHYRFIEGNYWKHISNVS